MDSKNADLGQEPIGGAEYDEFQDKIEDLTSQFTKELLECYLKMLRDAMEYISSREYLEECITANFYEFDEMGRRI